MAKCFVTSLSPRRIDRQQFCIDSWRAYGLPIVAVQTAGESEQLAPHFAGVEFREVDAKPNVFDKPYLPRIYDMLAVVDFDCILINSDIQIKDTYRLFQAEWLSQPPESIVVGVRQDYSPGRRPVTTPYGVDAFRITPLMARALRDDGFVIGMPGWDYWLPWLIWNSGFFGQRAKSTLLHHLHPMGWDDETDGERGRKMLADTFRLPPYIFTVFIQWLTHREGLKRRPIKP